MTSSNENIFLKAALYYASVFNWRVFPCAVRGKKPLISSAHKQGDPLYGICKGYSQCGKFGHGCLDATTDEAQIRAWWAEHPNANVGIATGKESNLAVVDLDIHKGASYADLMTGDLGEEVFRTIEIETGGKSELGRGVQFFYTFPNFDLRNSASALGNFIDVRGEGGYVVAPPSVHESGLVYTRLSDKDTQILPFPIEWIEKLQSVKNAPKNPITAAAVSVKSNGNGNGNVGIIKGEQTASDFYVAPAYEVQKLPDAIVYGTRHDQLFKIACGLRAKGLSLAAVNAALQQINTEIVVPPGPSANVRKIAESAMRYNAERELKVISEETIQNWDDVSIARLFCSEYAGTLRFNVDAKKWLVWQETHWQTDSKGFVELEAQKFSQGLYSRVSELVAREGDMQTASRQIRRSNTKAGQTAFLDLARPHLTCASSDLDKNDYLLNFRNGTVNLRTGEIFDHDPADLITRVVNYDYNPAAKCPSFDEFLLTIQPDAEIRTFLQQSIGYSLLGIVRERAFWIMHGSGNNGKSVFINLFSKILGDYASNTSSSSVMNKKNDSIPNDIARLVGKRFIVIPETEENERLNAALLKQLSGGDKISARFLFGEWFDFYFSGKLWIATNHKPTITDHSKGFWDRLKIIPFTVDIPKEKIIKQDTLLAMMLAEASGIINWALQGAADYFKADGLEVPEIIQTEIANYKYEQDSIAQFIDEKCLVDEHYTADNAGLYDSYTHFCKDTGEYARSQRRLTQTLKERGFTQSRTNSARMWGGLMLK